MRLRERSMVQRGLRLRLPNQSRRSLYSDSWLLDNVCDPKPFLPFLPALARRVIWNFKAGLRLYAGNSASSSAWRQWSVGQRLLKIPHTIENLVYSNPTARAKPWSEPPPEYPALQQYHKHPKRLPHPDEEHRTSPRLPHSPTPHPPAHLSA
jgi:hypothetical protein